jgi:hypothetical protein
MKLYKSSTGEIFAYELDGSQDHLIGDKIALTSEEIDTRNAEFAKLQAEGLKKEEDARNAALSAKNKLSALGLTEEEINSLLG